jgi:hypothetical protein
MFRSALPFGASLIYLLLLGSIVGGGVLFLVGGKWNWRPLKCFGTFLAISGVGLLCLDAYFNSLMDWNPHIDSDARAVGTWKDERETITLHADHRVDYHSWNEGFSGTWSRFDWNLRLQAVDVDSEMRFIRYDGELRLMTNPPDDPDQWNGVIGLRKVLEKGEK